MFSSTSYYFLSTVLLLISLNSFSACPEPAGPYAGKTCQGAILVKSLPELGAYLSNYGYRENKDTIRSVTIDFDYTGPAINIATPCAVSIKEGRTFNVEQNICVRAERFHTKTALMKAQDIDIATTGRGIYFAKQVKVDANNIKLNSGREITLPGDSLINVQTIELTATKDLEKSRITVQGPLNLENLTSFSATSAGHVNLGESIRLTGGNVYLESQNSNVVVRKNAHFDVGDITVKAANVGVFHESTTLYANNFVMENTKGNDTSRLAIGRNSNISVKNFTMNAHNKGTIGTTSVLNIENLLKIHTAGEVFSSLWQGAIINANRVELTSSRRIHLSQKVQLSADSILFDAPECTLSKKATLTVNTTEGRCFSLAQPRAVVRSDVKKGEVPLTVTFDLSRSKGDIDHFEVDYADGSAILNTTETSLTKTFSTAGTYKVAVKLVDQNGQLSTRYKTITVYEEGMTPAFDLFHAVKETGAAITADFSADELPDGLNPDDIDFFEWDFSGIGKRVIPYGTSGSDEYGYIEMSFDRPRNVNVSLTIHKKDGTRVWSGVQRIKLQDGGLPTPKYSVSNYHGPAPLTVNFSASESYASDGEQIVKYCWRTDEGNNCGADLKDFSHSFTQTGVVNVRLKVYSSNGLTERVYIPIYVGVDPATDTLPPVAIIATPKRFGAAPYQTSFTAAHSFDPEGGPLTYEWEIRDNNFPGDKIFNTRDIGYNFQYGGTYEVSLTVTDEKGNQDVDRILVFADSAPNVKADFFAELIEEYPGTVRFHVDPLYFRNPYDPKSIFWTVEEGSTPRHYLGEEYLVQTFGSMGEIPVTMSIRTVDGKFKTVSKTIRMHAGAKNPVVSIAADKPQYEVGELATVTSTLGENEDMAKTTFRWDYNGYVEKGLGERFSTYKRIMTAQSIRPVMLYAINEDGFSTRAHAVLQVQDSTTNNPPMAEFFAYDYNPVAPETISFDAIGSSDTDGFIVAYDYDFGDGNSGSSDGGFIAHTYTTPGTYTVTLTVTDNLGATGTDTLEVTINANQVPTAGLTLYGTHDLVAPSEITGSGFPLSSDADGYIANYQYDWGDGSSDSSSNSDASHTYTVPGTYTITLTVTDDKGATASDSQTVTIVENQLPIAGLIVETDPITINNEMFVTGYPNSSDPDGNIETYTVDWGDGNSSSSSDARHGHTYTVSGSYTVTLTVTDNKGATATDSTVIEVKENQPPIASLAIETQNPKSNETINVSALPGSNDPDGQIVEYKVNWGDGNEESSSQPLFSHIYGVGGTYTVTLTVTDDKGDTGTDSVAINVEQTIGTIDTIAFNCNSESPNTLKCDATGTTSSGSYIQEFIWLSDSSAELARGNTPFMSVTDETLRIKSITLKATDTNGKELTLTKNVHILRNDTYSDFSCSQVDNIKLTCSALYGNEDNSVTSYEWLVDGEIVGTNHTEDLSFTEEKEVEIELRTTNPNGQERTIKFLDLVNRPLSVYPSLGQIELQDPNQGFYHLSSNLQFNVEGATIGFTSDNLPVSVSVLLNGEIVDSDLLTVTSSGVAINGALVDGENEIDIVVVDDTGRSMSSRTTVYGGSKTLSISLSSDSNVNETARGKIYFADYGQKSIDINFSGNNHQIENLPNTDMIVSINKDEQSRIKIIREGESSIITFDMSDRNLSLNETNLDFSEGLNNWEIYLGNAVVESSNSDPFGVLGESQSAMRILPDEEGKVHVVTKFIRNGVNEKFLEFPFTFNSTNSDSIVVAKLFNKSTGEESVKVSKLSDFAKPNLINNFIHENSMQLFDNNQYVVELLADHKDYQPVSVVSKFIDKVIGRADANFSSQSFFTVFPVAVRDYVISEVSFVDGQEYGAGEKVVKSFIQGNLPAEYDSTLLGFKVYNVELRYSPKSAPLDHFRFLVCPINYSNQSECAIEDPLSNCSNGKCKMTFFTHELSGIHQWNTRIPSTYLNLILHRPANGIVPDRVIPIQSSEKKSKFRFRTLVALSTVEGGENLNRYGVRNGNGGKDTLDGSDEWVSFGHVSKILNLLNTTTNTHVNNAGGTVELPIRMDDASFTGFGDTSTTQHSKHNDGIALDLRYERITEIANSQIENSQSHNIGLYREDALGVYNLITNPDVEKVVVQFDFTNGGIFNKEAVTTVFMENLKGMCETTTMKHPLSKIGWQTRHRNHVHARLFDQKEDGTFEKEKIVEISDAASFAGLREERLVLGKPQGVNVASVADSGFRYRYFYFDNRNTLNQNDWPHATYGWREIKPIADSTGYDIAPLFYLNDNDEIVSNPAHAIISGGFENNNYALTVMGYRNQGGVGYCKRLSDSSVRYLACGPGEAIAMRDVGEVRRGMCITCASENVNNFGQCNNCAEGEHIYNGACTYCPGGEFDENGSCIFPLEQIVQTQGTWNSDPTERGCRERYGVTDVGFIDRIGRFDCQVTWSCHDGVSIRSHQFQNAVWGCDHRCVSLGEGNYRVEEIPGSCPSGEEVQSVTATCTNQNNVVNSQVLQCNAN